MGLGQDNSVSAMEEMRGMDVMGSEVMISPEKEVEVICRVCSERGVRYWLLLSSVVMPSPTLFRAIWMGSRLICSGKPSVSKFSSSDLMNCKLF